MLLPLFYRVKPLAREALRARLLALAERAGARVLDAYEWELGREPKKANAALTGLGRRAESWCRIRCSPGPRTRRSRLSSRTSSRITCTATSGRGWRSRVALLFAGEFQVAARVLGWVNRPARACAVPPTWPALPLLVLAAGGRVARHGCRYAHAMSRAHERRADRFALGWTRNAVSLISAMRRLSAQNLAEEHRSSKQISGCSIATRGS